VDLERDATGKRRQKWITCHGNKRDAERRLAEIVTEINNQLYITPSQESLGAYLERWVNDYSSMRVRATTLDGYRWRVKSINSILGHIRLSDLRPEHLQRYYSTRLAEGKAPGTIIKHHHLLRQALGTAVKWKLTSHNVGELVDPPRKTYKEMMALNDKEVLHLLETCADTEWYPIFNILFTTGLRRSELLALRWIDVDLTLASLQVVRVLHQLSNGQFIFGEPKTSKARRKVALMPSSCVLLRKLQEDQKSHAESLGLEIKDNDLIFSKPDLSPIRPDAVTRAFRRISRQAGFTGLRLHDCRHTHASLMLKLNVHPKIVSERLGHSGIAITLDLYSHLLPGMQESAVEALEKVLALSGP